MAHQFFSSFGIAESPFESTNADNEPSLGEYFVSPPYFASVMGNPSSPQSDIVFAPRGGGKTAQRRMIEDQSGDLGSFMCVTLDAFDQPPGGRPSGADLYYHLAQVCRALVLAVLVEMESRPQAVALLDTADRKLLEVQIDHFLGRLSAADYETALRSVKTLGTKTQDFLKKYALPIGLLIEAIKAKYGLDFNLPQLASVPERQDASIRYHLNRLAEILAKLGYESTYVLVDKVDEAAFTGTPDRTYSFISALLTDLPTLELPNLAFKFFLWDAIAGAYDESGLARRDRVPVYTLNWSPDELSAMLQRRLAVYSGGKVNSFNDFLEESSIDAHRLIVRLSAGSPRNMIRLSNRIVSEALRVDPSVALIPESAVWAGLSVYADEIAHELIPKYLPELKRVDKVTFTAKHLGSEVFRISENAVRRKLQLWTGSGVVAKVDEIPNDGNRPLHLYGVVDPRVCLAMLQSEEPGIVLGNYMFVCRACQSVCISDRADFRCHVCDATHHLADATTLLDACRRV